MTEPNDPIQQYPPPQPARPPRGRRWLVRRLLLLGVCLSVLGVALTAFSKHHSSGSSKVYTVTYEVDGTATEASLTMQLDGGTSQQTASLPLTNKGGTPGIIQAGMRKGAFVYIAAQNQDSSGTVTCHILVDGVEVVTNTSSGAYVIATCSGRL